MMGPGRREYNPSGNGQISRDVSPHIMAHGSGAFRKAAETRASSGRVRTGSPGYI